MGKTWTAAIALDDVWEDDMVGVEVEGTKVLIVNIGGDLQAYTNVCPHQASALDEGDFDGETITCARHLWEFDARTGRGVNPADATLRRYPCMVNDDGMICVDVG